MKSETRDDAVAIMKLEFSPKPINCTYVEAVRVNDTGIVCIEQNSDAIRYIPKISSAIDSVVKLRPYFTCLLCISERGCVSEMIVSCREEEFRNQFQRFGTFPNEESFHDLVRNFHSLITPYFSDVIPIRLPRRDRIEGPREDVGIDCIKSWIDRMQPRDRLIYSSTIRVCMGIYYDVPNLRFIRQSQMETLQREPAPSGVLVEMPCTHKRVDLVFCCTGGDACATMCDAATRDDVSGLPRVHKTLIVAPEYTIGNLWRHSKRVMIVGSLVNQFPSMKRVIDAPQDIIVVPLEIFRGHLYTKWMSDRIGSHTHTAAAAFWRGVRQRGDSRLMDAPCLFSTLHWRRVVVDEFHTIHPRDQVLFDLRADVRIGFTDMIPLVTKPVIGKWMWPMQAPTSHNLINRNVLPSITSRMDFEVLEVETGTTCPTDMPAQEWIQLHVTASSWFNKFGDDGATPPNHNSLSLYAQQQWGRYWMDRREVCPICMTSPSDCITECGHTFCHQCLCKLVPRYEREIVRSRHSEGFMMRMKLHKPCPMCNRQLERTYTNVTILDPRLACAVRRCRECVAEGKTIVVYCHWSKICEKLVEVVREEGIPCARCRYIRRPIRPMALVLFGPCEGAILPVQADVFLFMHAPLFRNSATAVTNMRRACSLSKKVEIICTTHSPEEKHLRDVFSLGPRPLEDTVTPVVPL